MVACAEILLRSKLLKKHRQQHHANLDETLLPVMMGFNRYLRIDSRVDRLTIGPGAVLLRDIVAQNGIVG